MIHWKDLGESRSDAFKARWRRGACPFARRNADGTCMGYSRYEDDEPVDVCKVCDRLEGYGVE